MHFKRRLEFEYGFKQIEIIPLVNLIFLLLLLFLFVSTFTKQAGVKVSLPKTAFGDIFLNENIEISLLDESNIQIDGRIIKDEPFRGLMLEAAKRKLPVLIKADRRVSLDRVMQVLNICRSLGVDQLNIITDRKK